MNNKYDIKPYINKGINKLNNYLSCYIDNHNLINTLNIPTIQLLLTSPKTEKYFLYANTFSSKKWCQLLYNKFKIYHHTDSTYSITILNNEEWKFRLKNINQIFIKEKIKSIREEVKLYCNKYKVRGLFFIELAVNKIENNNTEFLEVHPHIHGLIGKNFVPQEFKKLFSGGVSKQIPVEIKQTYSPKRWFDYCCSSFPFYGYIRKQNKEGKYYNSYSVSIQDEDFDILIKSLYTITLSQLTFAVGNKPKQLLNSLKDEMLSEIKEGQTFIKENKIWLT